MRLIILYDCSRRSTKFDYSYGKFKAIWKFQCGSFLPQTIFRHQTEHFLVGKTSIAEQQSEISVIHRHYGRTATEKSENKVHYTGSRIPDRIDFWSMNLERVGNAKYDTDRGSHISASSSDFDFSRTVKSALYRTKTDRGIRKSLFHKQESSVSSQSIEIRHIVEACPNTKFEVDIVRLYRDEYSGSGYTTINYESKSPNNPLTHYIISLIYNNHLPTRLLWVGKI